MGIVLINLSKAYDCITHNLLISKLAAYGFDHYSLLLIHSYLSNRNQRVKVGSEFSDLLEIKSGVPQVRGQFLDHFLIFSLIICFSK